jgi:hypothetical protein
VAEWTSSHKAAISTADSDLVLVARSSKVSAPRVRWHDQWPEMRVVSASAKKPRSAKTSALLHQLDDLGISEEAALGKDLSAAASA